MVAHDPTSSDSAPTIRMPSESPDRHSGIALAVARNSSSLVVVLIAHSLARTGADGSLSAKTNLNVQQTPRAGGSILN